MLGPGLKTTLCIPTMLASNKHKRFTGLFHQDPLLWEQRFKIIHKTPRQHQNFKEKLPIGNLCGLMKTLAQGESLCSHLYFVTYT